MEFLKETIQLLVQPPGDLVYFLVTLFALQQMLTAASMARGARRDQVYPTRWVWAAIGMLIVRGLLILVSLLTLGGVVTFAQELVPLERWSEVVSILPIIWAGILSQRPSRWQTWGLVLLIAFTVGLGVYSVVEWPAWQAAGYAFSGTPLYSMWEVLSIACLGLALVLNALVRPVEWEWAVGAFLFWLLGHGAELLFTDASLHISGWERLSSLIVFPLLAMLAHRQLSDLRVIQSSRRSLTDVIPLQTLLQTIESSRELEPALIIASSRLADLLGTDVCAIALTTEAEPPTVRVVAIHPPSAAQITPPELVLTEYPALHEAYQSREPRTVSPGAAVAWLPVLFGQLGMRREGTLAVLPMHQTGRDMGLILLGSYAGARGWDAEMATGGMAVASAVASAITRSQLLRQETPLLKRLTAQDAERQKTEQILERAKEQVQLLSSKATALARDLKARDQQIQLLNQELARQGERPAPTELTFWQQEVETLVQEREQLESKVQKAAQEHEAAQQANSKLVSELNQVRPRLEMFTEDYERLQAELETRQLALVRDASGGYGGEESRLPNSGTGLIVVDQEGRITTADVLARQMLQLPEGDVFGLPINGAYPDPHWTQTVDGLLAGHSNNGSPGRAHLTLTVDDAVIEAELASLVGRDGRTDGLAITLRSPENPAERYEALMGLVTEFRTPMTAITGYTDLLLGEQAGILTEMQQQFLERVKANAEQLNHLVSDLVRVVTPDQRAPELSLQPVNLIEIIEEAIMGLAARFRERKLAIRLDLPPEAALVQADRDSLYQIMLRLISNAVLCSREGSEIVISARQDSADEDRDFIRISVIDTGGGISLEDYPRVFRRFYRANQPLVQGMGETGVGMAVAKALVEANGGRIWVDSQPEAGSTFSFVLPTQPQMMKT